MFSKIINFFSGKFSPEKIAGYIYGKKLTTLFFGDKGEYTLFVLLGTISLNWLINLFQSIVFQTVMSGVLVFVFSDIVQKFFLTPLQQHKKVIGKVDNRLKFYANVITNPGNILPRETYSECSRVLRELSCELEETYKQIPFKKLDSHKRVSDAASRLIRLSNNLSQQGEALHNSDDIDTIRKDLNIPEL